MSKEVLAKGIDVSKHQAVIDWQRVKASGIEFAIIRVGYRGSTSGTINEDAYFKANIEGALQNGIEVGVYFYSTSLNEAEALEEAKFTVERIKGYDVTFPVVFDYEGYTNKNYRTYGISKEQRTKNCKAFQDYVKAKGYTCMIYGSKGHIRTKFDLDALTDYLWVARYASNTKVLDDAKYFPDLGKYTDRIAMWQYTSIGRVEGINGNVDMDYMYIDVSNKQETEELPTEEAETEVKNMGIVINAYSKKKDGNKKLSANFKVKEFACKDGSDPIFIAPALVELLQKIRNHFGKSVNINSAYRTATYNKKVGGATYSQHCYGTAADIRISGVTPKQVAAYVETLMPNTGGIGIYKNFTHVDVREVKSRWNG